ncbi:MAG: glucose-1-phosphate cytidylyltransferase [Pseudomonadota bacterium]
MKAVILCGGQGTRIRDVSEIVPKPMLPIGNYPVLWHIMKIYAHAGITDFVICLGYKGWQIKEFFLEYKAMTSDFTIQLGHHNRIEFHNGSDEAQWRVTLVDTGLNAQTGARLWNARAYLDDTDRFCLTYGDGVADVDVRSLLEAHARSEKVGMLTGVRPAGRFGELELQANVVTSFHEKPNARAGCINGGFMVFDAERVWSYLHDGEELNLEQEVLPAMVADRQLAMYEHRGFWQCMDTFREYTLLNEMWKRQEAPWKVW